MSHLFGSPVLKPWASHDAASRPTRGSRFPVRPGPASSPDSVVPDGLRGVYGSPEIVLGDFADWALRILSRTPEPNAGVTISLQLEPDRWRGGSGSLATALHLAHNPGLVLDVMAELMGEHVRLSSVTALRAELTGQLIEESEVEVDRRVGWTVERSDCEARMAAGRVDAAGEVTTWISWYPWRLSFQ